MPDDALVNLMVNKMCHTQKSICSFPRTSISLLYSLILFTLTSAVFILDKSANYTYSLIFVRLYFMQIGRIRNIMVQLDQLQRTRNKQSSPDKCGSINAQREHKLTSQQTGNCNGTPRTMNLREAIYWQNSYLKVRGNFSISHFFARQKSRIRNLIPQLYFTSSTLLTHQKSIAILSSWCPSGAKHIAICCSWL